MTCCNDSEVKEVVLTLLALVELTYTLRDGGQVFLHLLLVTVGLELLESSLLLKTYCGVVDFEDVDGILVLQTVLVGTHDGLHARVDAGLGTGCSLFDAHLGKTRLDGLGHTAQFLDFLDVLPCLGIELLGEFLHVVGTCPWVDVLAHLGLVLDVNLRVACDTCGEIGRKGNGLVQGIGVQGLGVTQYGSHGQRC